MVLYTRFLTGMVSSAKVYTCFSEDGNDACTYAFHTLVATMTGNSEMQWFCYRMYGVEKTLKT